MHLLLVTFSLRNQNKDYAPFFVALRGNALNWSHFIEQTCIVSTWHNHQAFAQLLYPHIEQTDSLLVAEIDADTCQGWLPQQAWDWLQDLSKAIRQEKIRKLFLKPPPSISTR